MFRLPPLTPLVRSFLIALIALLVLSGLLENFASIPVVSFLQLETRGLSLLTPLQLFTHVFVVPPRGNPVLQMLVSCFFLWLILAPFEERYGKQRVIQLIVASSVAAGLCALLVGLVMPGWASPISGPSTVTLAAIAAFCALQPPHAQMSYFGAPIQARQLLWFLVGLSALFFIFNKDAGQLAADLGAIGAGVLFVNYWMRRPPPRRSQPKRGSPKLRVVRSRDDDEEPRNWLN